MQHNSAVGVLTFANVLGAQIFGISVDRIVAAVLLTLLGVCGRLAVEAYLSFKNKGHVDWAKICLLAGVGLLSAVTITIGVLAILKSVGVVNDDTTILSLMFFGALGPDGLQWFMILAAKFIKDKTGVTPPSVDGITPPESPKP